MPPYPVLVTRLYVHHLPVRIEPQAGQADLKRGGGRPAMSRSPECERQNRRGNANSRQTANEGRLEMLGRIAIAAAFIALVVAPALAQNAPADTRVRIRGTVEKLDGSTLQVKSREGKSLSVALAPDFTVSGVTKKSISDIKTGDFVASTSVKGTDGKLHAVEIHFLPANLRATIEGQTPTDLVPDGLMTNAVVSGIAAGSDGQVLKVAFKGSEAEITVGSDVPIVTYVPGDPGLLKPGAAVYVIAMKKPDGSLTSARVTAEKDGIKPPM
jgi:hypothetical protein